MQIDSTHLENQIKAIHAAPEMVVLEFAGAGAQALAWLHQVAGSSRTILEATDRYASASLSNLLGYQPSSFTAPEVARAMATKAYIRACHLSHGEVPLAGIGCTATLATDRAKQGDHRCCLVVCAAQGVTTYTLTLLKGRRTRQEEENLVSLLILRAVGQVCGLDQLLLLPLLAAETLVENFEPIDLLTRLLHHDFNWIMVTPEGRMTPGDSLPNIALLSGAFNPLHQGHRQLAEVAGLRLTQPIYFELPLVNADKEAIDPAEAQRRLAQFANFAPLLLTCTPLFSQKAQLFPHSIFVVGLDTAQRLFQPRFYQHNLAEMQHSLQAIRVAGCRFLVAGRLQQGRFLTLQDIELPLGYQELFEAIPEDCFRLDISSTAMRTGQL